MKDWNSFPKKEKKKRNFSGGMTIRKIPLEDRLIKKKEFYHIINFPDFRYDKTHQPASLILFAMTDPAWQWIRVARACDWQPSVERVWFKVTGFPLHLPAVHLQKPGLHVQPTALGLFADSETAIARDRESFSALLFLSNSLCKMTRDFH